jgi:uncharacterized membrane protein
MIFGYFDFFIISLLIYLNIKYWKNGFKATSLFIVIGVLFLLVFPFFSFLIELNREIEDTELFIDLRALYGILKIPLYWVLGILQIIVFGLSKTFQESTNSSPMDLK